ncbi:MAG: MurR/RpiR family transcriptional regulator [Chloroflexi bacterium]|nr:MurR/RpiR family transcriptional regulator [Chloroflexota bacterium]
MEELSEFQRRLENCLPRLTKSEQRIAEYLLTNYEQAAFLSAAELAQQLDVSEATIVRFAPSVGYSGFPELKRVLQHVFRTKVTPATRLQHKLADLKTGHKHIFAQVVEMELQYLNEALHSIDPGEFDRAIKIIADAKRLFVRGGGPSAMLADLFELRMCRFGILTISITESGRDIAEKLQLMHPNDVLLATGFHHAGIELTAVIDHARKTGCRIILLTDTLGSTYRDKVDVVLSARRGPVSNFHSLTVPMAIVNALILGVAMSKPKASLGALDRFQELRATYGLDTNGK